MGGDHHYTPPKTDGTFNLKIDWLKLSKANAATKPAVKVPFVPKQPITQEELATKTLSEWFHWRSWRKVSPFEQFSVRGNWENYASEHLSGRLPSATFMRHLTVGLIVVGFIASYPKNVNHLYAKNH